MKKRRWLWALAGVIAYLALLRLLVYVESFSPEASIGTMGEAVWFSLVTLTTAGYGDYYPVTVAGRAVGTLFLLLSTGLMALLIGAVVSLMMGRLLPWMKLWRFRGRNWYVFSERTERTEVLAEELTAREPGAMMVFCGQEEGSGFPASSNGVWLSTEKDAGTLLKKKWTGGKRTLFFMGEDGLENYTRALEAVSAGGTVCCQTALVPVHTPEGLILFDPWESCARLYWSQHPLVGEDEVVLIGCGRCGSALLEQGLMVNLSRLDRGVNFHVFGDDGSFLRRHPYLDSTLELGQALPGRDGLQFHTESWDADADLLARAGRIILCGDGEGETLALYSQLLRAFPVSGAVHMHLSRSVPGAVVFGTDREIYTPELVLRSGLDRAARAMHEIYRQSTGGTAPRWEELSDFLRRSNRAAADHLLTKARLLLEDDTISDLTAEVCRRAFRAYTETREEKADFYRELEHLRWMRFHSLNGWRYAPERDNARRLHPDLRPFDELTQTEQAKDDYAWELLGSLAQWLEGSEREGAENEPRGTDAPKGRRNFKFDVFSARMGRCSAPVSGPERSWETGSRLPASVESASSTGLNCRVLPARPAGRQN